MKKTTITIVLLGIILVCGWGLRNSRAQSSGSADLLKIGVVDVGKALTECQANLDREKQMKVKEQTINAEMDKLSGQADSLGQELKNALEPGSKEYMARLKEWFTIKAQFEALKDYQKESFTTLTQAHLEVLYERVLTAIASVARQEGITLVLNKDESSIQTRSLSDLFALIRTRQILYSSAGLDITGIVIEKMDLSYEQEKTEKNKTEISN